MSRREPIHKNADVQLAILEMRERHPWYVVAKRLRISRNVYYRALAEIRAKERAARAAREE